MSQANNQFFLNFKRVKAWAVIIVTCYTLILIALVTTADGIIDFSGKPVATDFITFYSASRLLQKSLPATLYDAPKLHEEQKLIVNEKVQLFAWHYPPPFMLIVYPLHRCNYYLSWLTWTIITVVPLLIILSMIYHHPLVVLIFLAFPGTFQNIIHGQNGFLTASLFGAGLWLLKRKPVIAGFLLGSLIYKPHFAIIIVPALIAGKHYKALSGFATAIAFWVTSTVVLWGLSPWLAFIKNIHFASSLLENGALPYFKIPTAFSGAIMIGFSLQQGRIIQLIFTIFALISIIHIWRNSSNESLKYSTLIVATLIASPFAFDYDLVILAPVIAIMLAQHSQKHKFNRNWALLFWTLPFLAPAVAGVTNIQVAPLIFVIFISSKIKSLSRINNSS